MMGMIVTSTGFVSSLLRGNQRGDDLGDSARRDAVTLAVEMNRVGGRVVKKGVVIIEGMLQVYQSSSLIL